MAKQLKYPKLKIGDYLLFCSIAYKPRLGVVRVEKSGVEWSFNPSVRYNGERN